MDRGRRDVGRKGRLNHSARHTAVPWRRCGTVPWPGTTCTAPPLRCSEHPKQKTTQTLTLARRGSAGTPTTAPRTHMHTRTEHRHTHTHTCAHTQAGTLAPAREALRATKGSNSSSSRYGDTSSMVSSFRESFSRSANCVRIFRKFMSPSRPLCPTTMHTRAHAHHVNAEMLRAAQRCAD